MGVVRARTQPARFRHTAIVSFALRTFHCSEALDSYGLNYLDTGHISKTLSLLGNINKRTRSCVQKQGDSAQRNVKERRLIFESWISMYMSYKTRWLWCKTWKTARHVTTTKDIRQTRVRVKNSRDASVTLVVYQWFVKRKTEFFFFFFIKQPLTETSSFDNSRLQHSVKCVRLPRLARERPDEAQLM